MPWGSSTLGTKSWVGHFPVDYDLRQLFALHLDPHLLPTPPPFCYWPLILIVKCDPVQIGLPVWLFKGCQPWFTTALLKASKGMRWRLFAQQSFLYHHRSRRAPPLRHHRLLVFNFYRLFSCFPRPPLPPVIVSVSLVLYISLLSAFSYMEGGGSMSFGQLYLLHLFWTFALSSVFRTWGGHYNWNQSQAHWNCTQRTRGLHQSGAHSWWSSQDVW